MNLNSHQVEIGGAPLQIMASEIYKKPKHKLAEASPPARPAELGDAFFWINGKLVDIGEHRNHRDWLVAHAERLGLPDYIQTKPVRALWEAYKKGIIRIVWDRGGSWKSGAAHKQGNVLYLNGFEKDVWNNMASIINNPVWAGHINTLVIEYVRDVGGKPNWYHTDIFRGGDLEALYRGKRPRRERAPPDATYGGEPTVDQVREYNQRMNQLNDSVDGDIFEMFQSHQLRSSLDMTPNNSQNRFVIQPNYKSMR